MLKMMRVSSMNCMVLRCWKYGGGLYHCEQKGMKLLELIFSDTSVLQLENQVSVECKKFHDKVSSLSKLLLHRPS